MTKLCQIWSWRWHWPWTLQSYERRSIYIFILLAFQKKNKLCHLHKLSQERYKRFNFIVKIFSYPDLKLFVNRRKTWLCINRIKGYDYFDGTLKMCWLVLLSNNKTPTTAKPGKTGSAGKITQIYTHTYKYYSNIPLIFQLKLSFNAHFISHFYQLWSTFKHTNIPFIAYAQSFIPQW